jgi:drug/metabolite transporter (DMT)-like permease
VTGPGNEGVAAVAVADGALVRPMRGIVFLLIGVTLFPMSDAVAKTLVASTGVLMLAWLRYGLHTVLMLPVAIARHRRRALLPRHFALQFTRGLCLATATLSFFAAVRHMPLADAIALVFVHPFVVTLLSPMLLGEKVGVRRWSAVVAGFIGVLIVLRPGLNIYAGGTLFALTAGISYGLFSVLTRRLAGSSPPLVTLSFTALVGLVATSATLPWAWQAVPPALAGPVVLMTVLGIGAHGFVIRAFEEAPASLLAPLGYFEIVGATGIGLVVFGDFPDPWAWLGIGIIVASGIYIAWRERQHGVAPTLDTPAV